MRLNPILAGRRSVRAFSERPVSEEDLAALMEAVRWTPSSGNLQPWRFLARSSENTRAELAPCLSRGNQWALRAPLLLVLVTQMDWSTRANGLDYALYDCGQAALALTFEAETRGLRVHQIGCWIREPLTPTLRLPKSVTPVTGLAVGYEGNPESLDESLRQKELRPRTRKSPTEIWAMNQWPDAWGTGEADVVRK